MSTWRLAPTLSWYDERNQSPFWSFENAILSCNIAVTRKKARTQSMAKAVDAKRGAKRCGDHPSILSRWPSDEIYRASQVAIGWTETHVKYLDYWKRSSRTLSKKERQSGGAEGPHGRRFLCGRQIAFMIYEYLRVTGAHEAFLDYSDLFSTRPLHHTFCLQLVASLVSIVQVARWTRLNELCPHTKHRSQSVESLTSQCFRPDVARVRVCLDCGHRQQFPVHQILNEQESSV